MKIPIGLLWDSYGTPEGFVKDDDANGAPMGLLKASENGGGCLWDSCGAPEEFQKDKDAYGAPMGLLKISTWIRMPSWAPMGLLKDS